MKLWLYNKNIKMYSTHNEGKPVVSERFYRSLKRKIYKYMTSTSKNVYIDQLNDIVDKYKEAYDGTIKMTPIAVISNTYIDFNLENKKN